MTAGQQEAVLGLDYQPLFEAEPGRYFGQENVTWLFTNGLCFQLALAIHQISGWRLCSFVDAQGEYVDHSFVCIGADKIVDAEGLHDATLFIESWEHTQVKEINLDDFFARWPGEKQADPTTVLLAQATAREAVRFCHRHLSPDKSLDL